jgi:hypothetical protein
MSMSEESTGQNSRVLPFSFVWPLLVGVLLGLGLRLAFFDHPNEASRVMEYPFIYFVPLAIGAITVYVAETRKRRSWSYYFWVPVLSTCIWIIGTLLIMIEGLICAILIIPLFSVIAGIGGLLMGAVCRRTNWPKHAAYSLAMLPLALGIMPGHDIAESKPGTIERTIQVGAPPDRIWHEIMYTRDIQPEEIGSALIYRIGVPLPLAGVVEQTPDGLVRKLTMGKSVYFDQVVADWQENRHVRFTYRFYKDSFPPYALDEHVRIGGRYFDMVDTEYTLTPIAQNSTAVRITMRYRVNTSFNWYSNYLAQVLIGNFEDRVLEFYRHRATINGPGDSHLAISKSQKD